MQPGAGGSDAVDRPSRSARTSWQPPTTCNGTGSRLAAEACGCIEGLQGWVGVDLLLDSQQVPIVLEINPRLTTSFLGYRRLARFPLGRLAGFPEQSPEKFLPGDWHGEVIEFTSDGTPATCLR